MAFVFPVVGATEWSGGSWMPDTLTHRGRTHAAIDIYAEKGAPVVAPIGGTVTGIGSGNIGGHWVRIQGDDGNTYYFAHMDQATHLSKGDAVLGGAMVGLVGNSGTAQTTKAHLHFSMKRDGADISPIEYLKAGVIIPNVSQTPALRGAPQGRTDWGAIMGGYQPTEPETDESAPSTMQQVEQYRQEQAATQGVSPEKQKASQLIQNSLRGMSEMVQRYGFQTEGASGTGIAEIDRTEVTP